LHKPSPEPLVKTGGFFSFIIPSHPWKIRAQGILRVFFQRETAVFFAQFR
jgi:hypothetical protein